MNVVSAAAKDLKTPDPEKDVKLDVDVPLPKTLFYEQFQKASALTGRGYGEIFREIVRLQFSGNRLSDSEYFKYRIYETENDKKNEFVGQKKTKEINKSTSLSSKANSLINNKYYLENFLKGVGLDGTETLARIADPASNPAVFNLIEIATQDDLRQFLSAARYPIFGKPSQSSLSLGTIGIAGFDFKNDRLTLTNGKRLGLETFFEQAWKNYKDVGYIFQSMIEMHPELSPITGSAVGTVRLVTIHTPVGIEVFYTAWKIPSLNSMADNFWRDDNLISFVDKESGEVLRCQKGSGVNYELIDILPGTNIKLIGLKMPCWEEVRKLGLRAAALFPDNRIIGFDIAISKNGPLIVEANPNPDHGLYQIASGRGLLNNENRDIISWNIDEAKKKEEEIKSKISKSYKKRNGDKLKKRFSDLKKDLNG